MKFIRGTGLDTNDFARTAPHRKHRSQMTEVELKTIGTAVDTRRFALSDHAERRLRAKNIYRDDVMDAIKFGRVIEVNKLKEGDVRVLLRDEFDDGSAVCVVLSLANSDVVTCYENTAREVHDSDVRPDRYYAWGDDLVQVMQEKGLTK